MIQILEQRKFNLAHLISFAILILLAFPINAQEIKEFDKWEYIKKGNPFDGFSYSLYTNVESSEGESYMCEISFGSDGDAPVIAFYDLPIPFRSEELKIELKANDNKNTYNLIHYSVDDYQANNDNRVVILFGLGGLTLANEELPIDFFNLVENKSMAYFRLTTKTSKVSTVLNIDLHGYQNALDYLRDEIKK